MSQYNTDIKLEFKAPHNSVTLKYKHLRMYVLAGLIVVCIIDLLLCLAFHAGAITYYSSLELWMFLSYYLFPWSSRKQQQMRLLSGTVDREWYDTNTGKLNQIASRLASDLRFPTIQVEIGLKDNDYELLDISCHINGKINISARIVNEYSFDEIEFLLACSMSNFHKYKFNDPAIYPYIFALFCLATIPFLLVVHQGMQPFYYFGAAYVCFILTITSFEGTTWITSISNYKKILACTRNYEAAKSAYFKMSCLKTGDLQGEELDQFIIQYAHLQPVRKAAEELGLA